MSYTSPSVTPAHGSPVTLRTVLPQASRLDSPASEIILIAFAASGRGRWWDVLADLGVLTGARSGLAGVLRGPKRGRLHGGLLGSELGAYPPSAGGRATITE